MTRFATLRMLALVALRNLFSHRVKTVIVGLILAFGTALVVLGTSLLDSIEVAMERGITSSVAGHLQIYSSEGKDELALFGEFIMGGNDIGRIDDFTRIQAAVEDLPNVRAVVPMGNDVATLSSPGPLEAALERLRAAVRERGDEEAAPIAPIVEQVKDILQRMKEEREANVELTTQPEELEAQIERLEQALDPARWARFEAAPLEVLEFLDTKVAPIAEEGRNMYFRYLGTDVDRFVEHFDRFEVVEGERIPSLTRGIMFNERFYERAVKHRMARQFDRIQQDIEEEGLTFADDPGLQAKARHIKRQYQRITQDLDSTEAAALEAKLRARFPEVEGGLRELLTELLTLDDDNFQERFDWFYRNVAPYLRLYAFDVGDEVTIRAYTKSGFLKALNMRLYGIFRFEGLEKSDVAGGRNLIDMLTFRELYGLMTDAKKEELAGIREEVGLETVTADEAEAAFFGGGESVVVEVDGMKGFDEFEGVDLGAADGDAVARTFTQSEIDRGLALSAAVVLEDRAALVESQAAIQRALDEAGLKMKVVDWQQASGIVGQYVLLIRAVLYVAIVIIFLVALVIINNSMVMATMERVTEIGTMRAIGAHRSVVLAMFLLETAVLGAFAATLGALASVSMLSWFGQFGLPAPNRQLIFLFGGPELFPAWDAGHVIAGFVVISLVSLVSTLYPAFIATRIPPVSAMRTEE